MLEEKELSSLLIDRIKYCSNRLQKLFDDDTRTTVLGTLFENTSLIESCFFKSKAAIDAKTFSPKIFSDYLEEARMAIDKLSAPAKTSTTLDDTISALTLTHCQDTTSNFFVAVIAVDINILESFIYHLFLQLQHSGKVSLFLHPECPESTMKYRRDVSKRINNIISQRQSELASLGEEKELEQLHAEPAGKPIDVAAIDQELRNVLENLRKCVGDGHQQLTKYEEYDESRLNFLIQRLFGEIHHLLSTEKLPAGAHISKQLAPTPKVQDARNNSQPIAQSSCDEISDTELKKLLSTFKTCEAPMIHDELPQSLLQSIYR